MSDTVILEIDKGIARITLNRPDRGNALNQEMADALLTVALRDSDRSRALRALLVSCALPKQMPQGLRVRVLR